METLSVFKNVSRSRSPISVHASELFHEFIKNFRSRVVKVCVLCLINRCKSLIEWLQVPAVSCWLFHFVSSGLWPVKFANLLLGDFIKFPLLSVLPFPSQREFPKFPPLWIFYRKLLQFMNFERHTLNCPEKLGQSMFRSGHEFKMRCAQGKLIRRAN